MDVYEQLLLDSTDLDTFNVLCSVAIFMTHLVCVIYVLWRALPFIKGTKLIDKRYEVLDSNSLTSPNSKLESAKNSPKKHSKKLAHRRVTFKSDSKQVSPLGPRSTDELKSPLEQVKKTQVLETSRLGKIY